MKKLRIGGPNLGPGQQTWFWDAYDNRGNGEYGQVPGVPYGAEIPLDRVVNAQQLVDDGRASIVDDEPADE